VALSVLLVVLSLSLALGLFVGTQRIQPSALLSDDFARALFFRLRLPRVVMALLIGASLALCGAALQALFRNPLAEPYTLGVSGGGALGASVAIALGWGARIAGTPIVFLAAFGGAVLAVWLVRAMARAGAIALPGSLLLAGIVVNLLCSAAVLIIQYVVSPNSALQILRWIVGSLDVVGFGTVTQMTVVLVPAWIALLAFSRQLHLIAMDEESAAALGVNVRFCETAVHLICSLIVGVTVATGGAIGFVGLIVPHAVRLMFGEDLRIVMPGSLVLGAAFLVVADALARTALSSGELPVGAITGVLGAPAFLWLLRRRQRYSTM
jgi:iron complex transport system permease protein